MAKPTIISTAAAAAPPAARPKALPVRVKNIPACLRNKKRWLLWEFAWREGRWTKVPYAPSGSRASTTNPATWFSLPPVLEAYRTGSWDGIGFVLTGSDDIVGVDLDRCRDARTGTIEPWAQEIIDRLNSYTEISPSGTGVHIFVLATFRGPRNRRGQVEIYASERYFAITGHALRGGDPRPVESRHEELDSVAREYLSGAAKPGKLVSITPQAADDDLPEWVHARLAAARRAQDSSFARLYRGEWHGNYQSQSEADLALISKLLTLTEGDRALADRLFRASGLCRDKWLNEDYRDRTIERAAGGNADVSQPVTPTNTALSDAEIIRRASNATNGTKFKALWAGNIDGYGSQSEADAALCSILWFWTGDRETVRRLFGQSGLGQRHKWQRLDYQESTLELACHGETFSPEPRNETDSIRDQMQAALDDPRPKVRLPGDDWLLSETAAALGQHLGDKPLFVRNGEIVLLETSEVQVVAAQTFRTLVERFVVCYRKRSVNTSSFDVDVTMREDEARGIMASPQFKEKLRNLKRVNLCRLPILRATGKLELLPEGYDAASQTLTVSSVTYAEEMPLAAAVDTINDLFGEFRFADGERSKAVAIAALFGLYAAQLLPEGALRPCIIVTKNAEGAGATTLVSCAVVPILGRLPTGVASGEDEEMRKMLTAAVREARPVLLFDNQRTRLASSALEAFLSSPTWSDRLLGVNETVTGPNIATAFVTANGCTFSPDMRRRSLVVELHLEVERAEDRQFRRPLESPTLLALRPKILAACWSLVRHWHTQGQPLPSRSHSAFPAWAKVIGGIVEAAGFACPLDTASVAVAADEDGEAMRTLVEVMEPGRKYKFAEIVELCRANECFDGLVGDAELKIANRVTLARLFGRYDHRLVKNCRFVIEDKGHKRRFCVETIASDARSTTPHKA